MAEAESDALMLYSTMRAGGDAMVVRNNFTEQDETDVFQDMVNDVCTRTVAERFQPRRHYTERRLIESGSGAAAHGAVLFRAVRATDKHPVVVKFKKPRVREPGEEPVANFGVDDEFMFNMFEVNFCRQLCMSGHPHIVRYYGAWALRTTREVFLEFEDSGVTLASLIAQRQNRIPLPEAAMYLAHALDALNYCHAQGVIHADVKEENMLVRDGVLRLADFGVARDCGTPFAPVSTVHNTEDPARLPVLINDSRHQAFELLVCEPHATCAVDVFALGCVLIKMIAGSATAFQNSDVAEQTSAMHAYAGPLPKYHEPPNLAIGVAAYFSGAPWTPPLVDLAARMLAWNAGQRIIASVALEHDFFYSGAAAASAAAENEKGV